MKNCLHPRCRAEFEPTHHLQKYCSQQCADQIKVWRQTKEQAEAQHKAAREWRAANPEKVITSRRKEVAKNYRKGKLPSWMFS